jgi:hypothetical protein
MIIRSFFTFVVCFVLSIPSCLSALPHPSPQFEGAGFRISLVLPEHFNPGFGVGGLLDISVWKWLHFSPNLEYSYVAHDITNEFWDGLDYSTRHSLHEISLNADLRLYPSLPGWFILPYGGGGFVFVVSNEDIHYVQDYPRSEKDNWLSTPGLGFDFLLGCDIPAGSIRVNVETKMKVGTGIVLFKLTSGLTFPVVAPGRKKHL